MVEIDKASLLNPLDRLNVWSGDIYTPCNVQLGGAFADYEHKYIGFSINIPNFLGEIPDYVIEFIVRQLIALLESQGLNLPPGSAKALTEIISTALDYVDQANEHTFVLRDQDSRYTDDYQTYPLISIRYQLGFRDDEPDGSDFQSVGCALGHIYKLSSIPLSSSTIVSGSCDDNYNKIIEAYNEIQ